MGVAVALGSGVVCLPNIMLLTTEGSIGRWLFRRKAYIALGILVSLLQQGSDKQVYNSSVLYLSYSDIVHPSQSSKWRYSKKSFPSWLFWVGFDNFGSIALTG
jgi:hypothetical protein